MVSLLSAAVSATVPCRVEGAADFWQTATPQALPVADVLHGFLLNCLCAGRRFAHVRYVQGDSARVVQETGAQLRDLG